MLQQVSGKLCTMQYSFRDNSDCNSAKVQMLFNAKTKNYNIRKAFDSIDWVKLRTKLDNLLGKDGRLLKAFVNLYDCLNLNICGNLSTQPREVPRWLTSSAMLYYISRWHSENYKRYWRYKNTCLCWWHDSSGTITRSSSIRFWHNRILTRW